MGMKPHHLLLSASLFIASPAHAIELGMPIACDFGQSCYIQNYFDHIVPKGEGAYRDYTCGTLSYDGHTGTDFRLSNYTQMEAGVDVLAVAAGEVRAVRDDMPDVSIKQGDPGKIKGKECGNGVAIVHEGGYETQYCHLKKGSITVKPGVKVAKGKKLGQVGLSGMTEFPHVELAVRKDGEPVDPFTGTGALLGTLDRCPKYAPTTNKALWDKATRAILHYNDVALLGEGFSTTAPGAEDVRHGKFGELKFGRDIPALIFWVDIMGLQKDDDLTLSITSPDGMELVKDTHHIESNKALFFKYIGKKGGTSFWAQGMYEGEVSVTRKGAVILKQQMKVTVE
jgi:hypothetical protein